MKNLQEISEEGSDKGQLYLLLTFDSYNRVQ